MPLQPPVVQENVFFSRIFVYLFFRPRVFVHAFAILAVFVPHFFVCVLYYIVYYIRQIHIADHAYFLYKSVRTEMGLAILRSK